MNGPKVLLYRKFRNDNSKYTSYRTVVLAMMLYKNVTYPSNCSRCIIFSDPSYGNISKLAFALLLPEITEKHRAIVGISTITSLLVVFFSHPLIL